MKTVFDRYVKEYDDWYDKNSFAYQSELNALKKILPKKGKSLEIGVGTGRFAGPLGIKFGIDPSARMIRIVNSRGIKARVGKGEDLPFLNSLFDYVVIINTLCFVKEPLKVLEEAKRVLRRKGKIIIGIIDRNSFLGKSYRRKKSIFYKNAHFFSVKEITGLLRDVGCRSFSYTQTLFSMPGSNESIEKPKKGFGEGGFVIIKGGGLK